MTATVFDLFDAAARRVPAGGCLCAPPMAGRSYHPDGVEIDYRAARERVAALRALYREAGYGRGHRVALLLENRPDFHLHWWALNALGCGIVPINPAYRQEEMVYLIDHSEAALVVSVPERLADVEAAVRLCAASVPIVDAAALPARLPAPLSAVQCGRRARHRRRGGAALHLGHHRPAQGLHPHQPLLPQRGPLVSGGRRPDGAGGGLRAAAQPVAAPPRQRPRHRQHGDAERGRLHRHGRPLPSPELVGRRGRDQGYIIHYLGIMPPLLLSLPPGPQDRAHAVRFGAGAGIDPKHHEAFEARFGFPLIEGWGMTEVAMPTWASVEPRRIDTRAFGRPLSGCEVRVVDDEDREVPPGVPGELTLRMTGDDPRSGLFSGYLKDPAATDEAWRGGWFHTGDVVTQAADGMLCFVDRKKNIIRRSGENIAAAEVEAVLQADERVAQAAVIAVPDELRQEEVMACIVPVPGAGADRDAAEALQDMCLERLAYYKAPGYLLFLDTLPVTSTQKVQKVKLFPEGTDPRQVAGCHDLRARKRSR